MGTGDVLRNGHYQAVLLPDEARFPEKVNRVIVKVEEGKRILIPVYDDEGREGTVATEGNRAGT